MLARRTELSTSPRNRIVGGKLGAWVMQRPSAFIRARILARAEKLEAITTNNEAMARTMRILRDHGQARSITTDEGYNGRLDALQAGFSQHKLPHLAKWNRDRQEAAIAVRPGACRYCWSCRPFCPDSAHSVYHLYVISCQLTACFWQKHLAKDANWNRYSLPGNPLHLQEAYRHLQYPAGSFSGVRAGCPRKFSHCQCSLNFVLTRVSA